jgi:brefeldin A-resistance guanine nucleotide exchange factor 1
VTEGLPERAKLQEQRRRKGVIVQGTTRFNESPRKGIAYLASQGIIEDSNDANAVAAFLTGTSRIDKRILGEFISKKGNEAILDAFMN